MPDYPSKERVVRDGYLVYPEGEPIPETDVDELRRQGYLDEPTASKARKPDADKARTPAKDK